MTVTTMTLAEYLAAFEAQNAPRREEIACICPMCKTAQTPQDLIDAGAGKDFAEVEKYFGFSCVGRFTGADQPRKEPDGKPCNWSLGGLFKMHDLEVITPDGDHHPRFAPAPPAKVVSGKVA